METARGVVEFRYRPRSFLFPRGLFGLLLLIGLIWILTLGEVRPVMIGVYVLMVAAQLAIPIIGYVSALRHPVAVRLTAEGVEWPAGKVRRSWPEIAAVRVRSRKATRFGLPGLLLISRRELAFAERADAKPSGYGVDTRHLVDDRETVLAAILRYVDVPVHRD